MVEKKHETIDSRVRKELNLSVRRQIAQSSLWFIRLRWGASLAVALAGIFAKLASYPVDWLSLLFVSLALSLINLVFYVLSPRYTRKDSSSAGIRTFNLVQVAIDWIAVSILIHLTGGILSPCIFFFFFHLVVAAILLPSRNVYPLSAFSILLLGMIAILDTSVIVNNVHLLQDFPLDMRSKQIAEIIMFSGFTVSVLILVLLTSWVGKLIRKNMYKLSKTKIHMKEVSERLEGIFKVIRSLGEHSALDDLLDSALTHTISLWSIRSGFVLLKKPKERSWFFAAIHGMESLEPDDSELLDRPAIEEAFEKGDHIIINDLRLFSEFATCRSLRWLDENGKRSILLAPLRVGKKTFGAFCLASQLPDRFNDEEGKYLGMFCDLVAVDIRNITTNQQLQEHNRTKTWFYRRAAHDLRAPVSAVRSMLSTILEGYVENPEQQKAITKKADFRLGEMQESIDELLILAEDRIDRLRSEIERIDLNKAINDTIDIYRHQAQQRNISIKTSKTEEDLHIDATADGVNRILSNLISNAIKYNLDGGEVCVFLKSNNSQIELIVSDTGIGIPQNSVADIFQEFYRAPNAKSHTTKGTGLGLAIVRELVENFNGKISVSRNEKSGTSFKLRFPCAI